MPAAARKLPAIVVPVPKPIGWTGPRPYRVRKKKAGAIRPLKHNDPHLTTYDVMLMAFDDLGASTTNAARDYAFARGLMARVPKKSSKAGGLYSHNDRLFPAIISRLYYDYRFIDEVSPVGRNLRHVISDKGRAFLKNRLEKFIPDSELEEIQLKMNLGRSVQKVPPRDYSALDPVRRRLDEAKVRTAFDAALAKFEAIPPESDGINHFVYMQENGGLEEPFIYRSGKYRTVIRFSEDAHPFHPVYQEYVGKARALLATLRVAIDYSGGDGNKPFAIEIKLNRQKTALVTTNSSSPAPKGIHKNPKIVQDTKQEPVKPREADVRVRPDPSRQIVMPLTLVKPGALLLADQVRILDDEIDRVTLKVFQQREARIIDRFELARDQIDLYLARKVPTNDPIPCPIDLPSHDLANPFNPYHYVAKQYFEWADANGFDVVLDQITNGFSVLFRPKRRALPATS
jgi:hypothetical protein